MISQTSRTPLPEGGLAVVLLLMALVALRTSWKMGHDAQKAGQPRSVPLAVGLSVIWGPAALPYAGAWAELALVAGLSIWQPFLFIVFWLIAPLYVPAVVSFKNGKARSAGAPAVAWDAWNTRMAEPASQGPGRLLSRRRDTMELTYVYSQAEKAGQRILGWVMGSVLVLTEVGIVASAFLPTGGRPPGGMFLLLAGNLMFAPIALLFGGAFWALFPLGFRARFDRAAGTFSAERVQRTASPHEQGRLEEIAAVEATLVAIRLRHTTVHKPGLVLELRDGRTITLLTVEAYPTPGRSPEASVQALETVAVSIREFLSGEPKQRATGKLPAFAHPMATAQPAARPPTHDELAKRRNARIRQSTLAIAAGFTGLVFLANPSGPNMFPKAVAIAKAPFLSPLERVLEGHRDALRGNPAIRKLPGYQHDTVLGVSYPFMADGVTRLDDRAIAEFIAAQSAVVSASSDAFLSAGQDGRAGISNADFEPILVKVGPEALARYLKVQEDAIAASLARAHQHDASPHQVEAAWGKFRAGLTPEDRARYAAIPKDAKGASDADLGWAARIYWQRLSRMNHANAAIIVRNAFHGSAGR